MTGRFCVELAGIPGAGKTWLGGQVVRELNRLGVRVLQPDRAVGPDVGAVKRLSRKAAVTATSAVQDPRLALRIAGSIARSHQPGMADVAARFVQWQVTQGLMSRPAPDGAVQLLDEGLVQSLWSIGLRGDAERALTTLEAAGGWRAPDLLVVVRTPPTVAAERLRARVSQHSRSQQLPADQLVAELEGGERLLERLVAWWGVWVPSGRVVEVDGAAMTPAAVRALAARVASAADECPPPGPKVLHICTRYQRGGSERRIRDMVAALPEMRHDLLLGRDSDAELAREQTSAQEIRVLPSLVRQVSPGHDLAAVAHLWRQLRRGEYAVVVTHQSKAGALGRLAAVTAGGPRVVHSLSMGSFGAGYGALENLVFRRLERLLGQRTAAFCVVGSDLAARFAAVGVPPERLHVVRSGVPLPDSVQPRAHARQVLHERYRIPPGAPLVAYVGSLEPRKNVLLLAVLLYELRSRLEEAPYLLVVGDGPQRAELEARIRALGLERQAVFTGHLAEPDRVREAIRGSDLVALLSKTEGLPQVLVQSAAEGTPFVAFDVEGVQELLALGARGTATALGDLSGVVDAATRHLRADGLADREPVADLTSWTPEAIRAAYRCVFRDVLGRASARRPTPGPVVVTRLPAQRRAGATAPV